MSEQPLERILADEDILPLGRFETVPVVCEGGGEGADYPEVARLADVGNWRQLAAEAVRHMEIVGARYLRDRASHLDPRIAPEHLKRILADVGFVKGLYQSYSLRKLGTNQLEDFILPETRRFFSGLGIDTFRQQYAVSQPGWKTKLHRDHGHFRTHGFRAMVPLASSVYMGYERDDRHVIYRLDPGALYFVNIVRLHRGFTFDRARTNLMFQMASDALILATGAQPLEPLVDIGSIPEDMLRFERVSFDDPAMQAGWAG